jgi:hypothetical protein
MDYYKQILDIFKFKANKKYVNELRDTDELDATSILDITDKNGDGIPRT